MIKIIKSIIYDFYMNFKFKKIIHKHDKITKEKINTDKSQKLFDNGSILIENFLNDENIENFKLNFKWISSETSLRKVFPTVIKKNSLPHLIISNKHLNNLIKSYIGINARLDSIEIQKIEENSYRKSISEKWHYDNVGRRIKVFYFLNDCKNIYTQYLNKTNNLSHNSYTVKSSRISEKKIKKYEKNLMNFYPKKNSLLIIDTNGFHRGVYSNNLNNDKKNFREMIVFEYSDIKKSEDFYGITNIIGPRFTYFDTKINLDETLIEKKYLSNFGDFYSYDLGYSKYL